MASVVDWQLVKGRSLVMSAEDGLSVAELDVGFGLGAVGAIGRVWAMKDVSRSVDVGSERFCRWLQAVWVGQA
ncbi:unnamed protein product [Ilex paraguariensis]|uniref:Uncharacterized protein n=1 Tax=Ilex paraguariensis TaxID=185542 RepID=A0ABC8RBT5_9AQUA